MGCHNSGVRVVGGGHTGEAGKGGSGKRKGGAG